MEELLNVLDKLSHDISGDWKKAVLIDNTTNNPLIDAYNEGVDAMAAQATYYVRTILKAKMLLRDIQKSGHTVIIERVGVQ